MKTLTFYFQLPQLFYILLTAFSIDYLIITIGQDGRRTPYFLKRVESTTWISLSAAAHV